MEQQSPALLDFDLLDIGPIGRLTDETVASQRPHEAVSAAAAATAIKGFDPRLDLTSELI